METIEQVGRELEKLKWNNLAENETRILELLDIMEQRRYGITFGDNERQDTILTLFFRDRRMKNKDMRIFNRIIDLHNKKIIELGDIEIISNIIIENIGCVDLSKLTDIVFTCREVRENVALQVMKDYPIGIVDYDIFNHNISNLPVLSTALKSGNITRLLSLINYYTDNSDNINKPLVVMFGTIIVPIYALLINVIPASIAFSIIAVIKFNNFPIEANILIIIFTVLYAILYILNKK